MTDFACACGCGGLILIQPHHKRTGVPKFILGHNSRVNNPHRKDPLPTFYCECGCKEIIPPKKWHSKSRPPRMLPGHGWRQGRGPYAPRPEEIPSGWCECGCGKSTNLATHTVIKRRVFAGFPTPFLPGHNKAASVKGAASYKWKGGILKTSSGYLRVHVPDHPHRDKDNRVAQHRLVMEEMLGRYLEPTERVHHKNGDKKDNRPENLELWRVKDPPGVRASDYHCPGCRCGES